MTPAHYYIEHGMRNLQVSLPRSLRASLTRSARERGVPLRTIYEEIITQFLKYQRRPTTKAPRKAYLATRRMTGDSVLQMWLAPTLFQEIAALARREAVTKRSVAYTALSHAYEHIKEGTDHAQATQGQTTAHRRRR